MGTKAGIGRRATFGIALAAIVSALGLAIGPPSAGAATPRSTATVSTDVEQGVQDGGQVDVVATLRTTAGSEPAPDPSTEQAWQRSAARQARALVDRMPEAVRSTVTEPPRSRHVALKVDAAGLAALRSDDAVATVSRNTFRSLSLVNSTKVIGAPLARSEGYTGSGQAVAILDSGVQKTHPFLAGRVVAEACFSGGGGYTPMCTTGSGGSPSHQEGNNAALPCSLSACEHGTHVAGIAAGANGPTYAPSGVAPGANIVALKVVSSDSNGHIGVIDSDALDALDWVSTHRLDYGIAAANLSFGGGTYPGDCDTDPDVHEYASEISALRANGVATVVASGNDSDAHRISAPACISSAIAVGSVDAATLNVSVFSNASPSLDFLAPGATNSYSDLGKLVGIKSSIPTNAYGEEMGTSMAAPHVAGAWAVMRQAYPGISVDLAQFLLATTGRQIYDDVADQWFPLIQLDEALPHPKGTYHPVGPTRILDTRTSNGGHFGRVGADSSIDLQVGGRGGVPGSGVSAVVLNLTYVLPSVGGYVTAWPAGTLRPTTSNLNLTVGDARPNLVTVRMGADGKVSLYNAVGSVDLVADVAGWYDTDADNTGSYYHSTSPARVLDTRTAIGEHPAKVAAGEKLVLDVTNTSDSPIPTGATAAIVNLTATGATAGTYVTAYSGAGGAAPNASNLNVSSGQTRPNLAVVPLDSNGRLTLYNDAGSVDLIADVQGWYDATPGYRFVPKAPTRILDTRFGFGGFAPGPNGQFDLQVGNRLVVPANAAGVVMNVTSTGTSLGGFVTVYPSDVARPDTSNLNLEVGRDVPNLVTTRLPANGRARIYNKVGTVQLIADVAGWFET
jgi:subtilisin family serine protease